MLGMVHSPSRLQPIIKVKSKMTEDRTPMYARGNPPGWEEKKYERKKKGREIGISHLFCTEMKFEEDCQERS